MADSYPSGPGRRPRPRSRAKALDDEDILAILRDYHRDAVNYADDTLSPDRQRAMAYYEGTVLNDDNTPEKLEPGRSSIVVREVADIIHTMLPGIIRVFAGGDQVVDYEPRYAKNEEEAKQATEYVTYLLNADGNNWFATLYDTVHDALLKKLGVIKWRFDESTHEEEFNCTGITLLQYIEFQNDPEVEILESEASGEDMQSLGAEPRAGPPGQSPPSPSSTEPGDVEEGEAAPGGPQEAQGGPEEAQAPGAPEAPGAPAPPAGIPLSFVPGAPMPLYDVRIRRTRTRRILRIEAMPPEEFLISRDARSVLEARFVGHRTRKTVSELLELGYDEEMLLRHATADAAGRTLSGDTEARQRNPGLRSGDPDGGPDQSTWRVPFVEQWVRFDGDGDGVAELHRVCTVGHDASEIASDEIDYEAPFAVLSAIRLPHAVIGYAIADQTVDLQDLKTSVLRSILDSLGQSIFPRTAVVENAVNMDDVLNNEVGAVIRMQAPGMMQPLSEPFIGPQALQVMGYLDEMRAQRTGISRQSQGLDANVLQSTTRAAVSASVEAQQDRVELIARTFAELGVKDVFKGLLRYIIRHQDKARVVRLRNQWVTVDPRFWDADMDVSVNVGLGRGTDDQRMQFLTMIAAKQEQALQLLGPDNALVSIGQLRATYAEMLRIGGFKNVDRFFKTVTPEQEQLLSEQMAKNKPADPNQLLAQVENQKTQAKTQTDQAQLQLDAAKLKSDDDFRRDQLTADILLRAAEIQAKYGQAVDVQQIQATIDQNRQILEQQHEASMAEAARMHERAQHAEQLRSAAANAATGHVANTVVKLATLRHAAQQGDAQRVADANGGVVDGAFGLARQAMPRPGPTGPQPAASPGGAA